MSQVRKPRGRFPPDSDVSSDRHRRVPSPALSLAALFLWVLAAGWTAMIWVNWVSLYARESGPRLPDGSPYGRDFLQFFYVANAWRTGTLDQLYDPAAQMAVFHGLGLGSSAWRLALRYNYPPFFAWLPRLLSGLDYRTAYVVWLALQAGFLMLAIAAWWCELAEHRALFWALLAFVAVSAFLPLNLMIGQTAFIGLAAFSWACRFLRSGRDLAAGLCIALLLYKPPLGVVIGPLLLVKRRWRTVAGVAIGGAVLLAASLLVSPRALVEYPSSVRTLSMVAAEQPQFYLLHYNALAFVTLLIDGGLPHCLGRLVGLTRGAQGATEGCSLAALGLLVALVVVTLVALFAAWRGRWRPDDGQGGTVMNARLATLVLATLLLSPYLFFYDTVLVLVPAVYTLRTLPDRPTSHAWLMLAFAAVALFGVGGLTETLNLLWFRLQPVPLAFLGWLWLEATFAAGQAK